MDLNYTEEEFSEAAKRAIVQANEERDQLSKKAEDLQAFKDYVHKRLDEYGVPADPYAERTKITGCRISGRLDWLVSNVVKSWHPSDANFFVHRDASWLSDGMLNHIKAGGAYNHAQVLSLAGEVRHLRRDVQRYESQKVALVKASDEKAGALQIRIDNALTELDYISGVLAAEADDLAFLAAEADDLAESEGVQVGDAYAVRLLNEAIEGLSGMPRKKGE